MSEPDAWGLLDEGEVHYATPFRDEAERVLRRTGDTDSAIVPLYRSPTLTDAERDLLDTLRRSGHLLPHGAQIIDGLLERLGGAE